MTTNVCSQEFTIDIRVRGFSPQPEPWLLAVIAAGVQGILDGLCEDVSMTWLSDAATIVN